MRVSIGFFYGCFMGSSSLNVRVPFGGPLLYWGPTKGPQFREYTHRSYGSEMTVTEDRSGVTSCGQGNPMPASRYTQNSSSNRNHGSQS